MITPKIYCSLDIGAQNIKAGIFQKKNSANMEILATSTQKRQAFHKTTINNFDDLSEAINITLKDLKKKSGVTPKGLFLGLDSEFVKIRDVEAVIPLIDKGNKIISHNDIEKLHDQARLLSLKLDEEILHDSPKSYALDDRILSYSPSGLYGRKLSVNMLILLIEINNLNNIIQAIQQTGSHVLQSFLSSYVTSDIILDKKDKGLQIIIDFGAKTTDVMLFENCLLQGFEKISFGSGHLTKNIAKKLDVSLSNAENIKKTFCGSSNYYEHLDEEILIKNNTEYLPIKKELIYNAIEPKIKELNRQIQNFLKRSENDNLLSSKIQFIGGGSLLPGLVEEIGQQLKIPTQLANCKTLEDQNFLTPLWANTLGVAQRGQIETSKNPFTPSTPAPLPKRVWERMKMVYEEYF